MQFLSMESKKSPGADDLELKPLIREGISLGGKDGEGFESILCK